MQLGCHPEPAFFAQRGTWASREKRRAFCDADNERLARIFTKLKTVLLASVLTLASSTATAQMRGSASSFAAHPTGAHFRGSIVTAGTQFSHSHGRNPFFPGAYFLGDTWLPDDSYSVAQPAPPVIVIQPDSSPKEAVAPSPARDPLLIELQGNRYVRYDGSEHSSDLHAANISPDYSGSIGTEPSAPRPAHATTPAPDLPPATLIFLDGRHEEATNYAIVSGVMYLHSDYWTSGAWAKRIQLAELDIPATLKANQERGVKFALPSAPNEVVTRP